MFYQLHRIYVVAWITFWIGGAIWVYPRSGVAEPIAIWYAVFENAHEATPRSLDPLSGQVIRVADGTSFTLKTPDRVIYSIGLAGAVAPPLKPRPTPEDLRLAQVRKGRLSELILSNTVEVGVASMDAQHRGLGVVRSGPTNVNAVLIESGLVELRRPFIKELPWREQYALIRADRIAQRKSAASEPPTSAPVTQKASPAKVL